ncbi:MAG: hypothetical protein HMLKMBBP_00268 [Planctomycetes bacterium]|nr:hypothetical protein [Planctomycetota bacterium]
MTVRIDANAPPGWDAFVRAHADGTPFHTAAWSECVASGLGWKPLFAWAERDGAVTGVLPASVVRSMLFGSRVSSSPQAAYGGPLAADAATAAALARAVVARAESLGVGYAEFRCATESGAAACGAADDPRWHGSDLHVSFGGPIAADDEGILKAIPKKTRADCRKADEALAADESPANFGAFRALFAANQHELGTPVLPTRFLAAVAAREELGPRILVVRHEGRPVAACLSLSWKERILPYWAGADSASLALRPNHGLYLNVLRFARRSGFTWYDFGRSKRDSGSYDFKKRWGFGETPLRYRTRLVRATEPPGLSPNNPRYARKIEMWKRLPRWVADAAGPLLSPGLS